ncbi:MAG: OmpA family protein [Pseudomonadota bacterium]|nr:OmpA family protein [Pseudomonadota bacterium]MDQ5945651.1 OmpA family protein [Pseudomonadota bacterium]
MKTKYIAQSLAAIGLMAMTALAQAQTVDRVYVIDQRAEVARSGTGLCWRTGFWTPAAAANDPAGCACDKDLLPKEKCEPPAAKAAAAPITAKPITIAAKELFDYDKAILKPEGKAAIDREVIAKLKDAGPIKTMLVTGHTDRLGSQQYNQKLSEKRAEVVKGYLVSKGVPVDKIETMGAGKTQPATGVPKCDDKLPKKKLIECLAPHRRFTIDVTAEPKK